MFDSFLEQFNNTLEQRGKHLLRENLNSFFQNCRKYYSIIEHLVNEDVSALKILIRMVAVLPLNRDNVIIGSEAARLFASIILKILSTKFSIVWSTIDDVEWPSFRDGLVILCCLRLLHSRESTDEPNETADLLLLIPEEVQRRETVSQLISLLSDLQCTLSENQEVTLYALLDKNHFELKHLDVVTSLETYVSYLTQLMMGHRDEINQLEEDIQKQLNTLLTEKRFTSKK